MHSTTPQYIPSWVVPRILGNPSHYLGGPAALKCHYFQILCSSMKHPNHMALQRHFHKVTELIEAQNPRHTFSGNYFPQCFWSYIKTIYSTLRKLPSSFLNHKIFKSQPTGKQNAAEEMQFSEREAQRTRLTRLSTCPTWESKAKVSNRENLWCRPQVDLLGVTSQTGLLHLCLRPQSPTERSWPLDTENPDTK